MCFLYRFFILTILCVQGAFAGGFSKSSSDSSSSNVAGVRLGLGTQTIPFVRVMADIQARYRTYKEAPMRTLSQALESVKREECVFSQDVVIEKSPALDVKVKKETTVSKKKEKPKKKTVPRKKSKVAASDELLKHMTLGKKRKRNDRSGKKSKKRKYQDVDFDAVKFWWVDPLDLRCFQLLGENNEVLFSDQIRLKSQLRQLAAQNRLRIKYNDVSSVYIDRHPDDDQDLKASGFAVKEEVTQEQGSETVLDPEPIEYSDDLADAIVSEDFFQKLEECNFDIVSFLENEEIPLFGGGFYAQTSSHTYN